MNVPSFASFSKFLDVVARGAWRGSSAMRALHQDLNIAPTPRRVIHDESAFELLCFTPDGSRDSAPDAPPVLFVPSLINRWYVLDLMPGHSTVAALLARGLRVYVMAWRGADEGMGGLGLPVYVDDFVDRAVRLVCLHARAPKVTLVGQCLGGTLAVAYAATRPRHVDRLVALTTPIDFRDGGLLATWSHADVLDVDAIRRSHPGVLPDSVVYGLFPLLSPKSLITKYRVLLERIDNADYVRLTQALDLWTSEHLPVGSGAFASLIVDLYRENRLVAGTWRFAGGEARLSNIECPILCVVAKRDDIVSLASARALLEHTRGPHRREFVSPMGHITLVVGSPPREQSWEALAEFCLESFG